MFLIVFVVGLAVVLRTTRTPEVRTAEPVQPANHGPRETPGARKPSQLPLGKQNAGYPGPSEVGGLSTGCFFNLLKTSRLGTHAVGKRGYSASDLSMPGSPPCGVVWSSPVSLVPTERLRDWGQGCPR